jgi:serine/threonine protein kinase
MKRRARDHVFDVSEVAEFAFQIAKALKYLHTR